MIFTAMCLLASSTGAAFCRYTVRDVAFVELEHAPYALELAWTDSTAALADALFEESNVERGPARPAGEGARLVAPDGRSLELALPGLEGAPGASLAALVHSALREELIESCLSQLGVVLLYEGSDAQANAAAALEARAAVEEARALVEHFPKPVGEPASLRVIGAAERELERVTSFGLGVSPELTSTPELVIVFGKLRRAGPVLAGAEITRGGLLAVLALLGESCECGLDRSWMTGPRAPVAWDAPLARRAAELLGFDARSQLVLAEVRSILARGVSESADQRALPLEERLLGYQEQLVQSAPVGQALERDVPEPAQEQPAREASSKLALALAGLGLASLLGAALVLGTRTSRGSA